MLCVGWPAPETSNSESNAESNAEFLSNLLRKQRERYALSDYVEPAPAAVLVEEELLGTPHVALLAGSDPACEDAERDAAAPGGGAAAAAAPFTAVAPPTALGIQASVEGLSIDELVTSDAVYNHELQWLSFDWRVLSMAADPSTPLFERLRFLAISARNLDEFFGKRVGALKRQEAVGLGGLLAKRGSRTVYTPAEQLRLIARCVAELQASATALLVGDVLPRLRRAGVSLLSYEELAPEELVALRGYFVEKVEPLLTPLAVDPGHPFPSIAGLSLSVAVELVEECDAAPGLPASDARQFAVVAVPSSLPRWHRLPGRAPNSFVPVEQIIIANLDRLFGGMLVLSAFVFRATRNADVARNEETAEDLLELITDEVRALRAAGGRGARAGAPGDPPDGGDGAGGAGRVPDRGRVAAGVRRDRRDAGRVRRLRRRRRWPRPDVPAVRGHHPPAAGGGEAGARGDGRVRRHPGGGHPAASPLQQLRHQHPAVRGGGRAGPGRAGHQVHAVPHQLGQPDGAGAGDRGCGGQAGRRPDRAEGVLRRGAQRGVREAPGGRGRQRRLRPGRAEDALQGHHGGARRGGRPAHVHAPGRVATAAGAGTGNYNDRTAGVYSDLGLLTCDPVLGADVRDLFKSLTGFNRQASYAALLVAPRHMRAQFVALINGEIEHARAGRPARVQVKVNGLDDPLLCAKLYEASRAGVTVDLVVRGICRLRPGVPGLSDRIRVVSLIGRFLEHHRIFSFLNGGQPKLFIGSADWMARNLLRRVEVCAPVTSEPLRQELQSILDACLSDAVNSWGLGSDGRYTKPCPAARDYVPVGDGRLARRSAEVGIHAALIEATQREALARAGAAVGRLVRRASK